MTCKQIIAHADEGYPGGPGYPGYKDDSDMCDVYWEHYEKYGLTEGCGELCSLARKKRGLSHCGDVGELIGADERVVCECSHPAWPYPGWTKDGVQLCWSHKLPGWAGPVYDYVELTGTLTAQEWDELAATLQTPGMASEGYFYVCTDGCVDALNVAAEPACPCEHKGVTLPGTAGVAHWANRFRLSPFYYYFAKQEGFEQFAEWMAKQPAWVMDPCCCDYDDDDIYAYYYAFVGANHTMHNFGKS